MAQKITKFHSNFIRLTKYIYRFIFFLELESLKEFSNNRFIRFVALIFTEPKNGIRRKINLT